LPKLEVDTAIKKKAPEGPPLTDVDTRVQSARANENEFTGELPKHNTHVTKELAKGQDFEKELVALEQQAKRDVSLSLFAVGACQALLGIWVLLVEHYKTGEIIASVAHILIHLGVFGWLGWWARSRPVMPAIWGLGLYVILNTVPVVIAPAEAFPVTCFAPWVKGALVLVLIRSARVAMRYDKLQRAKEGNE
jgi:hypothetical protein